MIGIIGLGLIGGSLGLALKKAKRKVIGYDLDQSTSEKALSLGAVDEVTSIAEIAHQCQIIILATPIRAIKKVLADLAPYLKEETIISDTASTKMEVMSWAQEILPGGVEFIGGHPMAGKERWGIEAASAELFMGATYCLVPSPQVSASACSRLASIVEEVGALPLFLSAQEHDFLVAGISHLPLLLSAALVHVTAGAKEWERLSRLASSGYRDVSRLASGNPFMSLDICSTNHQNILSWLNRFEEELTRIKGFLRRTESQEELLAWFAQAWEQRESWRARRFEA